MVATPPLMPVTMPVVPTEAMLMSAVLHVPPVGAAVRGRVMPAQTVPDPEMAGVLLTVNARVT